MLTLRTSQKVNFNVEPELLIIISSGEFDASHNLNPREYLPVLFRILPEVEGQWGFKNLLRITRELAPIFAPQKYWEAYLLREPWLWRLAVRMFSKLKGST